jgi:hypothetical protein
MTKRISRALLLAIVLIVGLVASAIPTEASTPREPTYPYGVMEIHVWWNATHERITPVQARTLTRYLNVVVGNRIAAYVVAVSIPHEANWNRVARCESGGDWHINTGNGYYGGLQFNLGTWQAYGGSGIPSDQSKAAQIRVAERVRTQSSLGHWPHCGPLWYG